MTELDWRSVAKTLLASRLIDTIEETELVPSGKVTYQFSAKGHELAQILLAHHLTHPHDAASVYYRSRPFVMTCGMTNTEAFAGPLAKSGSRNGGRDIGVVHNLVPVRNVTVLPASGDVGAQYTPAIGWAQAITYRSKVMGQKEWSRACAVAMGGDASVATNGFWAALNIATTQNYPILFFIEDNSFGISVPGTFQTPNANIAENLSAFGNLRVLDGDGANPDTCSLLIGDAVEHVRQGKSPVLLRLRVPRICGHSGADSQSYKSTSQMEDELARDPLPRLRKFLKSKKLLTDKQWQELESEVESEVRSACDEALSQSEPDISSTKHHVYFEGSLQLVGGSAPEIGIGLESSVEEQGPRMNLIDGIRKTLEVELGANERLLVFGEDVGVKGGVHGATMDLQKKFGSDRVFDTSLSEEGIIGRSVGMAYAGLTPVPEIQFRKYADPATEQINDAGTIRWRTNNQFAAPMVVRIPVGYSKRTGDPWHSVSNEAIYAHTLGWRIAIPSTVRDAVGLLRTALRGNDPTFFLEHRNLLDTTAGRGYYPGDNFTLPFGVANVIQTGSQATVVSWGEMVHRCKEAIELSGLSVDFIDLRTITPWDKESVLSSVRKTGRCLIAHEDTITAGFGAEISATISQECFQFLDSPVVRVATADCPIPYNKKLMEHLIPSPQIISEELRNLVKF